VFRPLNSTNFHLASPPTLDDTTRSTWPGPGIQIQIPEVMCHPRAIQRTTHTSGCILPETKCRCV